MKINKKIILSLTFFQLKKLQKMKLTHQKKKTTTSSKKKPPSQPATLIFKTLNDKKLKALNPHPRAFRIYTKKIVQNFQIIKKPNLFVVR